MRRRRRRPGASELVYAKTGEHFNRYAYGNNSPYSFTDPEGEAPRDLGWGGSPGGSSIAHQFSGGVGGTARAGNSGNVGAVAGAKISNAAAQTIESMSSAGGVMSHVADTTRASMNGTATQVGSTAGQEAGKAIAEVGAAAVTKNIEKKVAE
jgi:hypothetical protein